MLNLLNYIANGNDITETVYLYVDKDALIRFKRIEAEIADTINSDRIHELELEQAELRQRIKDGAVKVEMRLPDHAHRVATLARAEATLELDVESPEFIIEATVWMLAEAIVSIATPDSVDEAPFTPDDIRAFRDQLAPVPANWRKLVDKYDEMVNEDLLLNSQNTSPDFL